MTTTQTDTILRALQDSLGHMLVRRGIAFVPEGGPAAGLLSVVVEYCHTGDHAIALFASEDLEGLGTDWLERPAWSARILHGMSARLIAARAHDAAVRAWEELARLEALAEAHAQAA